MQGLHGIYQGEIGFEGSGLRVSALFGRFWV